MKNEDLPICQVNEDQEEDSFLYLLLVALLIIGYLIALLLRHFHSKYVHESSTFIMIGGITGLIAFLSSSERLQYAVTFDPEIFFLFLLPPIIFESGYNMNKRVFFANFSAIFFFAIFGTLISTAVVGLGLYGVSSLSFFNYDLGFMECVCFGALISATDPVTVLAMFKELKVDANLYSMVFGESVLNDAIAIVLYTTAVQFVNKPLSAEAIFLAITEFILISVGSVAVGIIVGLLSSVLYKHSALYTQPTIEFILLLLYAYSSYLLAEGLGLSGIVSILFCGITMAHYTRKNLSRDTKHFSIHFFEIMATMAETYVFLYLGLSIFYALGDYDFLMIIVAMILCLIGRALNIFPMAALSNLKPQSKFSSSKTVIPISHQVMLWFSGLRGAMAFALAVDLRNRTPNGPIFLTTTLIIVLCTVVILGGLTTKALELLNISMGERLVESDSPYVESWWQRFDRKYIKPIFTREVTPKDPKECYIRKAEVHSSDITNEIIIEEPSSPEVTRSKENEDAEKKEDDEIVEVKITNLSEKKTKTINTS